MFGFIGNRNKKQGNNNDDGFAVPGYKRKAYHSGSWYESSSNELNQTLSSYLSNVEEEGEDEITKRQQEQEQQLKGIVSPHAGYKYSGPTAAYAYKALINAFCSSYSQTSIVIIVLHPSHHVYLDGCAISGASIIETPLGNLNVNNTIRNELLTMNNNNKNKSKLFTVMEQKVDEEEHSGEMQYPFIMKAIHDAASQRLQKQIPKDIQVLPIMVGALSTEKEKLYGKLLSPILARSNVICIVSSDFCHWGSRFTYQPVPSPREFRNGITTSSNINGTSNNRNENKRIKQETQTIYEYIEELDKKGMDLIEMQNPGAFATYLKKTSNTICGRHPLGVWLNSITYNKQNNLESLNVKFIKYEQSSKVTSMNDSSVSYASAIAAITTVDGQT